MTTRREPWLGQIGCYLAAPKERVFGEHPIDLMHQLKRLCVHPNWCVIDRRTADLEQFTLTRQAQFCILFPDHLAAV